MAKPRVPRRISGTGQVYRDGKGWRAAFVVGFNEKGNPVEKKKRFALYGEAEEWLTKLRAEYATGKTVQIGKLTVSDWLDQWLSGIKRTVAPKTHTYYSFICNQHIKPALGGVDLRSVSVGAVQTLLSSKLEAGLSNSTVSGIRATLRRSMNIARKQGLLHENPAAAAEGPKATRPEPDFFKPAECKKLVEGLTTDPDCNLVRFLLSTGMRIGEAAGLRWDDVDIDEGSIHVKVQLQRIEGKLVLTPLKSFTSRRALPMIDLAKEAAMNERARQAVMGFANPLGLVFLNDAGLPWDQKTANDRLKAILRRIGLPEKSAHKLRHTAASLWLAAGVDPGTVRDLLGHSTIKLLDIYAHAVPIAHKEAGKKLSKALKTGKLK